ncbi:MAG: hypothetical protein RIC14_05205 [Filomicrobium sp.]
MAQDQRCGPNERWHYQGFCIPKSIDEQARKDAGISSGGLKACPPGALGGGGSYDPAKYKCIAGVQMPKEACTCPAGPDGVQKTDWYRPTGGARCFAGQVCLAGSVGCLKGTTVTCRKYCKPDEGSVVAMRNCHATVSNVTKPYSGSSFSNSAGQGRTAGGAGGKLKKCPPGKLGPGGSYDPAKSKCVAGVPMPKDACTCPAGPDGVQRTDWFRPAGGSRCYAGQVCSGGSVGCLKGNKVTCRKYCKSGERTVTALRNCHATGFAKKPTASGSGSTLSKNRKALNGRWVLKTASKKKICADPDRTIVISGGGVSSPNYKGTWTPLVKAKGGGFITTLTIQGAKRPLYTFRFRLKTRTQGNATRLTKLSSRKILCQYVMRRK